MTAEISDSGATVLRCHTGDCRYRKTLVEALTELNVYYKGAVTDLVMWVRENDGEIQFKIRSKMPAAKPSEYTTDLLKILKNPFPPEGVAFLAKKGCSVETARRMYCGWVDEYQGTSASGKPFVLRKALIFPTVVRQEGRLICVGAQAREIEGSKYKSKYTTIFKFRAKNFLYGEHLLNEVRSRRLGIVEGPLDANHLIELGEIANGVHGTFMGGPKVEKIKRAAPRQVAIFVDPDSPGRLAARRMKEELVKEGVSTRVIDPNKDPKDFTQDDLDEWFNFP